MSPFLFLDVHAVGEFGEKTWRKILSEKAESLEEQMQREAVETSSVRRAVADRLLELLAYLGDPEPEIRRAVAEALGCYPEHARITLAALRDAAKTETEPEVREALAESIGRLEA